MKKALLRIFRVSLGFLVTGAIASFSDEPAVIYFTPLLSGAFKFLRDKYGIKYLPL